MNRIELSQLIKSICVINNHMIDVNVNSGSVIYEMAVGIDTVAITYLYYS